MLLSNRKVGFFCLFVFLTFLPRFFENLKLIQIIECGPTELAKHYKNTQVPYTVLQRHYTPQNS